MLGVVSISFVRLCVSGKNSAAVCVSALSAAHSWLKRMGSGHRYMTWPEAEIIPPCEVDLHIYSLECRMSI